MCYIIRDEGVYQSGSKNKRNPILKGALPDNYYSRLQIDTIKLSSLLDEINKIDTAKDKGNDIVGRMYEYSLSKFAIAEGKRKGEFYILKTIVNLMAELIEPYDERCMMRQLLD